MSKRKLLALWSTLALLLCLLPMSADARLRDGMKQKPTNDIVVLYTNDVHCGIEDHIGYTGLAAYKKYCQEKTPYVTLVDSGDAIQGDVIGSMSNGQYLVDIMNFVGYDFAILGNHEFDYGMPQLIKLLKSAKAHYLACNISYHGSGKDELTPLLKPYAIVEYGNVSVAYVGVSTPESLTKSTPSTFMEDGKFVYSFAGESPEKFYDCVQKTVTKCRRAGVDYVVVLAHLGDADESIPYTSVDLIKNTSGIDVILDGHAHSTIPCRKIANKLGKETILTSTGTKLAHIGHMVINTEGKISTELISYEDPATSKYIDGIKKTYEAAVKAVVAKSDVSVTGYTPERVRLVRNRETAIGDLVADAYRYCAKSDIAFINGGGVRADLPKGDITFADIIKVNPYGNHLCMCECTGQDILDALEFCYRAVEPEAVKDGNSVGECGGFLQVSGLKCTIDTSIAPHVETDANGMFVKVTGERRVKDVQVLNAKGEYEPIDPKATYTVASQQYTLQEKGDGISCFADKNFPLKEGKVDYEVLISYIESLNGNLTRYEKPDNRITVK